MHKEVDGQITECTGLISIMLELSRATYLEDVLFAKLNSKERTEISSFIEMTAQSSEMADRLEVDELVTFLNEHLSTRMFLVGSNITAADVVVLLRVAAWFRALKDYQKLEMPHVFRWIDHLQHLPGLSE